MEHRATIFLEAMLVLSVIGVLVFLLGLLVRAPQGQQILASRARQSPEAPRWYEFTLALILLAAIAGFVIWIISSGRQWVWGEAIGDWRGDTRAITFAAIMVGLGCIGLAASLAYTLFQSTQSQAPKRLPEAIAETAVVDETAVPAPSRLGFLGPLVLAPAILVTCWIALSQAEQYELLFQLIYPGAFGVTLVLLLDKAARIWGTKRGSETVREWLFCDLLAFLLVLAFLNLRSGAKPETYGGTFWDLLNVVLFFAVFWAIDRTSARSRFLVGYGYLIVLPLLLLIWQTSQGVAVGSVSWWASMWPFLILAAAFFILEVITLVASTGERQILPALKDALFVVLYAVLLIVAASARSHA